MPPRERARPRPRGVGTWHARTDRAPNVDPASGVGTPIRGARRTDQNLGALCTQVVRRRASGLRPDPGEVGRDSACHVTPAHGRAGLEYGAVGVATAGGTVVVAAHQARRAGEALHRDRYGRVRLSSGAAAVPQLIEGVGSPALRPAITQLGAVAVASPRPTGVNSPAVRNSPAELVTWSFSDVGSKLPRIRF